MVNFTFVSVGTFSCDTDLVDLSVLVLAADLVAVDLLSAFEVVGSDFLSDFLSALSDCVFFLSDVLVTSVLVFSLVFFGFSVVCFLTGLVVEFWLLLAATLGLLVTGGKTAIAPAEEPAHPSRPPITGIVKKEYKFPPLSLLHTDSAKGESQSDVAKNASIIAAKFGSTRAIK